MKISRLISIFIVLAVLIDTCGKTIILAGFELNRDYLAKELCVKRQIKGNHCKGKCHLRKELKEEDQRENKNPVTSVIKFEINYTNPLSKQLRFILPQVDELHCFYSEKELFQPPTEIFRPPSC